MVCAHSWKHINSPQFPTHSLRSIHHLSPSVTILNMTANPKWDEITRELLPGQPASDRPDLVSCVSREKVRILLKEIKKGILGEFKGNVMPQSKVTIWGADLFCCLFMFSIQNKGPKYDVSTTVCCPLCEDDIQTGMSLDLHDMLLSHWHWLIVHSFILNASNLR